MQRRGPCVALTLVLSAVLAGCVYGVSSSTKFLSIATGGTGGVYYPYGGALARLISERLPGWQATAEVTGGSIDNLKYLQLGKVDIAFTLADTLDEAVKGSGPFQGSAVGSIRTLAVLYTNYTHVVVRQGSGVKRISDLRGRVVSVGAPGSGTELIADRVLAAAGIDSRKDLTRHQLSVVESAAAMKDNKLDAFFWSGGAPSSAIQDLAATPGMSIAIVPQDDLLLRLQRDFSRRLYRLAVVSPGIYRGIDEGVPTVGVENLLVASSSLDSDVVYAIVKLLYDEKPALVAAHPEARHLELSAAPEVSPAPFHPGAIRYYKEHGWK
jgi:uncharacterized protein